MTSQHEPSYKAAQSTAHARAQGYRRKDLGPLTHETAITEPPETDMGGDKESDETFRLAVEATQVGIIDYDPLTGRQTFSEEAIRMWGFEPHSQPTPDRVLAAVHPDDRDIASSATRASLDPEGTGGFAIEHRIVRPDGSVRWIAASAKTVFAEHGGQRQAVRSIGIMFDVTDRKLRDEALRAAEESLRLRNEQLSLVARVSQMLLLNRSTEQELLNRIFLDVAQSIGADVLLSYQPADPTSLSLRHWTGLTDQEHANLATLRYGEMLCGRVAEERRSIVLEDIANLTSDESDAVRSQGYLSYAGFPLLSGDELLGTVAFISKSKPYFAEGEVQTLQTICEQIAATLDRHRLATELAASEERHRLAIDGAGLGTWDVDLTSGVATWNQIHRKIQGIANDAGAPSIQRWRERIHVDDLDRVLSHIEQARRTHGHVAVEHRIRRADTSEIRWHSLYGRFTYNEAGEAVRLSGVSQDITDRKLAEEDVKFHHDLLMAVFEYMPVAINIIGGDDLRLIFANRSYRAIAFNKGDPVGKTLDELWPETGQDFTAICRRVLETGEAYHAVDEPSYIQRSPDGPTEKAWFTWSLNRIRLPGEGSWGLLNVAWETSQRVKAEEALRESEERFRNMADQAPVMIWITNAEGYCTYLSQSWYEFTGQTPDTGLGFGWLSAVHPEDARNAEEIFRVATKNGTAFSIDYRLRRQDGQYRWAIDSAHPRFADSGEFMGFIGSVIDITERKQVEDTLRVSGESFRQLVEHSPFGIYAVDADFRLAMVSAGAQKVFQNVRPLLGRDFDEVLHIIWPEPFATDAINHFKHVLATGESYHAPSTVEYRADIGQSEAYDWKLERVTLPDGRAGVVCHFYDLSERQRYEETLRVAQNRLETALEASQVVLFHQDLDLRYTWVHNPALGMSASDLIGKRDSEVLEHAEDAAQLDEIKYAAILTGTAQRGEVQVRSSGESRFYDLNVQPDRAANGTIRGVNCAAIDVTERKRMEGALRENDRRKDEFLATLSHELRNPLATLQSGLEVLRLNPDDHKGIGETSEMMRRQLAHLVALVDDLLEVSRITRGKLKLRHELVDISNAIEAAVETCRPMIEEAGHHLRVTLTEQSIYVVGDPHRLSQSFANLLNNATKYTPRGGSIAITVSTDGDHVVVAVTDSGIGIAEDQLGRVFEMFTQVENESSNYAGLGIGLSLVKSLVELHHGSIWAESAGRGLGSTFKIRLPVANEQAVEQTELCDPSNDATLPCPWSRILIVDDNVIAGNLLSLVIKMLGHEVATASNGLEAIEYGQKFQPQIILMDIGMPVMDGYEAARKIRTEQWGKDILLVALTGWGQDDDRKKSRDAGFDDHLVKPVDANVIQQVFNKWTRLGRIRMSDASSR